EVDLVVELSDGLDLRLDSRALCSTRANTALRRVLAAEQCLGETLVLLTQSLGFLRRASGVRSKLLDRLVELLLGDLPGRQGAVEILAAAPTLALAPVDLVDHPAVSRGHVVRVLLRVLVSADDRDVPSGEQL